MNGLDRLVDGLFDYAGMFPPASLPLGAALARAAAFHKTLRRPGLVGGNFVAACDRLPDVDAAALDRFGFPGDRPFRVCALGAALGSPASAIEAQVEGLLRADDGKSRIRVVSFELKLPATVSLEEVRARLRAVAERLKGSSIRLFLEPEWHPSEWPARLDSFLDILQGIGAGLKIRGSGTTAVDVDALSRILPAVNSRSLPLKATAGLHHPVIEKTRYGNALGFLTLAAALRLENALGPRTFGDGALRECLACGAPEQFRFEGGLGWKDFFVEEEPLAAAMRAVPFSIGSCSIDEPDSDLARLFSGSGLTPSESDSRSAPPSRATAPPGGRARRAGG